MSLGPLVRWELVRLARRGHVTRARVLLLYSQFLAVLLFAVWWSYPATPGALFRGTAGPLPVAGAAAFAGGLAFFLLQAQLLLVAAITPAYAAAAVGEEKDRQTLSLLLTTQLTDRDIVWGKAAARVVFVLAAVVAGVPVLMLAWVFGGVDSQLVASGYALTAGTVVLSAAIGVSAGCHTPDSRAALVRAYGLAALLVGGVLLPPFVLLSPFAMLVYVRLDPASQVFSPGLRVAFGFGYPLGQVLLAWALTAEATRNLRRPGPTAGPPEPTAFPEPPRGRPAPLVFAPAIPEPVPLPPVSDADPVLWKERHTGRAAPLPVLDRPVRLLGAVLAVVAVALFAGGGWLLVQRAVRALDPDEAAGLVSRSATRDEGAAMLMLAAGVLAGGLYLVPVAAGVSGCVARERLRGTLDPLLSTPLGRRSVLRSKVRAHAERGLVFAAGAAAGIGAGFGADGWGPGFTAGLAFGAAVLLVVGLGAWVSVRSETPGRAFRLTLPAVALGLLLPVAVANLAGVEGAPSPVVLFAAVGAAFAALGGLFWWRAGVALERGA